MSDGFRLEGILFGAVPLLVPCLLNPPWHAARHQGDTRTYPVVFEHGAGGGKRCKELPRLLWVDDPNKNKDSTFYLRSPPVSSRCERPFSVRSALGLFQIWFGSFSVVVGLSVYRSQWDCGSSNELFAFLERVLGLL